MTEHGAQYDHIGSKYDEYAQTATLKRAESYTFFRMVGVLDGQRVLDLAAPASASIPPVKETELLPSPRLRTGREGFPSSGSSISKAV